MDEREILISHLSDKQRKTFEKDGYFFVVSPYQHVYLLHDGLSIVVMCDGKQYEHRCAFSYDYAQGRHFDRYTSLLTQLLFLRSDPYRLLDISCGEGIFWKGFPSPVKGCPKMDGSQTAKPQKAV